jgi:hypothetical protein
MKTPLSTAARLFAVCCMGLTTVGAQAFELRGFRGVSWGEGAEALGAATVVQTVGDATCYLRERENMLFGDIALNAVRYCFHQDRLFVVMLDAPVPPKTFIADFARSYGAPNARRGQSASWGTKASGTRADLAASGDETARLTIYSSKIEPGLAQRIHKLSPPQMPSNVSVGGAH